MINNVVLVGRLTADIDLRYTSSNTAVGSFTLAVNRNFKNQSGEQEADFIRCVVWRKTAETAANYTSKGSLIGVTGRIQTRNYDNDQGQRVYVTEIIADSIQFLESKNSPNNGGQNYGQGNTQNNYQSNAQSNFGGNSGGYSQNDQNNYRNNQYSNGGQPIDISDDDLPF